MNWGWPMASRWGSRRLWGNMKNLCWQGTGISRWGVFLGLGDGHLERWPAGKNTRVPVSDLMAGLLSNRRATHYAEAWRFLVCDDQAPLGCPASK
jgi:hypothetical protein